MTASNSSRKRLHSPDKDVDDCLPISKRIHRLQIEPEGTSSTEEEYKNWMRSDSCADHCSPEEVPASPWQHLSAHPGNPPTVGGGDLHHLIPPNGANSIHHQSQTTQYQTNLMASHNSLANQGQAMLSSLANQGQPMISGEVDMERYSPELIEEENPHYFTINRLLFHANSSRIIRTRSSLTLDNEQSM